ncbi:putative membrane protein [Vibrio parahaemolyticus VPCR-2010]|nr:putative membrane protein [Vibrio parahaemolyticus VPCR-2010]
MSQAGQNSMYPIILFCLSTLLSTAVSITVVKNEIAYLLKK